MTSDNFVAITGNLVRDLELKSAANKDVVNFSIAVNEGAKDDEKVSYFDVTAWGHLATHAAASLHKGERVSVTGRLTQNSWEKDGERRSKVVIVASTVAAELRFATSTTKRAASGTTQGAPAPRGNWDEEPF